MKPLSYLALALFFAACQTDSVKTEEVTPLVNTRASSLMNAETENIDLEALNLVNPSKIIRKDSLYVILTPSSKYRFAIYNHRSGDLQRLVPAGKGYGQGMYFLNLYCNGNTVSSFDFGTGRLVEIDLSTYKQAGYTPCFTQLTDENKQTLGAIRIGERIISTGRYLTGRYCSTNLLTGTDQFSVAYPECGISIPDDTLKSIFYASNCLTANQEQNRIACANMQTGCLDICNIEGDQLVRINEVHLNQPGVVIRKQQPRGKKRWYPVAYTRENLFGFCDVSTSSDYVFALYSGRTYRQHKNNVDKGKVVLVFDWNGSHVRTYHLPESCSSISYDESTHSLYALAHKDNKASIVTLNLN